MGLKVHLQKLSSIEKKEWLLCQRVYIVVVLELCHRKEVVPIALLFIHKDLKVLVKLLVYLFGLPI